MNTYRVDRNDQKRTPCGMNSILYIGDSRIEAQNAFARAETRLNSWGCPNPAYGVILSKWDSSARDYVVIDSKGL